MEKHDLEALLASMPEKDGKKIKPPDYAVKQLEDTCTRTGLDWRSRHCYLIERGGKWRVELSIDGFRAIAAAHPEYDGQDGPYYAMGPEGPWTDVPPDKAPYAAKVGVRRKGQAQPTYATAKFADYQTGNMWKKFPSTMTAKCFDDQTEVLTDEGFQRFSEVTGRVLQVTENGLEATDAKPWSQDYAGPMVQLLSDDLNFVVTPNHDMITDKGRIEAGDLFEKARSRTKFRMMRIVPERDTEAPVDDATLELVGALLADGSRYNTSGWRIAVSRPDKIEKLRSLGLHYEERTLPMAGNVATLAGRDITTRQDQQQFLYSEIDCLSSRKALYSPLALSSRQAAIVVRSWLAFDGSGGDGATERLHTSNPAHAAHFETLAVHAGYAVSQRHVRPSPGARDRITLSVSERDAIAVRRLDAPSSISGSMYEGKVWCVTVPSSEIVVRREGFSMRCGNCAEMLALRKAFPAQLGGLYGAEEMMQAGASKTEAKEAEPKKRPLSAGSAASVPSAKDSTIKDEGAEPTTTTTDPYAHWSNVIEECKSLEELLSVGKEIQSEDFGKDMEVKLQLGKVYQARKRVLSGS